MDSNTDIKRQKLRVLLKLLVFSALVLMLIVFLKSLFPASDKRENNKKYDLLELNLKGIQSGEIKKMRFAGKEVAILKRKHTNFQNIHEEGVGQNLPSSSLNEKSRSLLPEYFVYFNMGDSGNCPLFFDGNGFKDICSQKRFDHTGREIGKGQQGYTVKIPPHFFKLEEGEVSALVVGSWIKK